MKRSKIISIVALPIFIVIVTILLFVYRDEVWRVFSTPERIQEAVDSWGYLAPLAFILVQFIQVVIFIIPGEIPQIAGGYLFGVTGGALYSVAGILVGSSFNFLLARWLGLPFVKSLFSEHRIRSFENIAHSSRAQIGFFLLFVIPGIPKDVLCYVAGLSPLRFFAFILISTLGRLPGIIGSAAMGDAAASSRWALAGIIMGIAVVLFFIGLIFRERVHAFVEHFALRPASPQQPADEDERFPAPGSKDFDKET
jgi:uncharacterized membrane protein YdjX (TVP38/TMEM64 family)